MNLTQVKISGLSKGEYKHPDAFIESCLIDGKEATEQQLEKLNEDRELVYLEVEKFVH